METSFKLENYSTMMEILYPIRQSCSKYSILFLFLTWHCFCQQNCFGQSIPPNNISSTSLPSTNSSSLSAPDVANISHEGVSILINSSHSNNPYQLPHNLCPAIGHPAVVFTQHQLSAGLNAG